MALWFNFHFAHDRSLSIDRSTFSLSGYAKDFKNGTSTFPAWRSATQQVLKEKSASLLVGMILDQVMYSFEADRRWRRSVRFSQTPCLARGLQTEHERAGIKIDSSLFFENKLVKFHYYDCQHCYYMLSSCHGKAFAITGRRTYN